jgi:hypothetical protein
MKPKFFLLSVLTVALSACSLEANTGSNAGGGTDETTVQSESNESAEERREREGRLWRERQRDYYHTHDHNH